MTNAEQPGLTGPAAEGPVTLVAGRILRAHGLRGEVVVEVRTDDEDARFAVGARLDGEGRPLEVLGTRRHQDRLLVRFAGIEDRTAAEALHGVDLMVDVTGDLVAGGDADAWYVVQLVGCEVSTPGGRALGRLTAVLASPGHDLLVVDHDGREVLVPFVTALVPEVDPVARRIVVDPPGGLFDDE